MPIVFIYVGYLLIAAAHPFEVSPDVRDAFSQFWGSFVTSDAWSREEFVPRTYVQKTLLFILLGIFLSCALRSLNRSRVETILLGLVYGGILTLFLEHSQIFFMGRHASAFDYFVKSCGVACGVVLVAWFPIRIVNGAYAIWRKLESTNILLATVFLYALVPFILFITRSPWFNFRNWDPDFTLQIANEATLNKPWLGEIYLAAVYSRALSPDEIARHSHLGFFPEALARRVQEQLVAFYIFGESSGNTVHDTSNFNSRLDLTFSSDSPIRWFQASNGIQILKPAILQSRGAAKELFTALSMASSLAIEVWIRPANITQEGSARIISFSGDIQNTNFMLGQYGSNIVFWLRTAISGRWGAALYLGTRNSPLSTEPVHIVAVYQSGRGELYVNGKESSGGTDLATDIIVGFSPRNNLIARIAYSFFYFFPLSFLLARFCSAQCKDFFAMLLFPIVIGASLLTLTEVSQAFAFHRPIDPSLLGYGTLVCIIGAFSGVASSTWAKAGLSKNFQRIRI